MIEPLSLLLGIIISALLLGSLGIFLWRERLKLEQQLVEKDELYRLQQDALTQSREQLAQTQTLLAQQRVQAEEKMQILQQARDQLTLQFKQLAQEILEDKSKRFTEQNRGQIEGLLLPLREQLKGFEQKIHETYDKETRDRLALHHEIRLLKDLNQQMSQETANLTRALQSDNKLQGNWGEMVLIKLLENAGLQEGREYIAQYSVQNEEDGRRYQPDVLVQLPGDRQVVIDAKVSLKAYEQYVNSEDTEQREQALKLHVQSVRRHVKELAEKRYHELPGVQSLDFVLLFVPIEGALMIALHQDDNLVQEALTKQIVFATPTMLLATLRTVHYLWRTEQQNRHAQEIARKAGALYDKFVGFVEDMTQLGKKLSDAQKAYDATYQKLTDGRGNLVRRTEELKTLGARASKQLPLAMIAESSEENALE